MVSRYIRASLARWTLINSVCSTFAFAPAMAQRTVATHESVPHSPADALLDTPVTLTFDHTELRQAIDAVAATGRVTVFYNHNVIAVVSRPITLHIINSSVRDAFAQVLRGTSLQLMVLREGQLSIVPIPAVPAANGIINGRVTNASTKQPIVGATVTLDGAAKGVLTGDDGIYHLAAVPAGIHTVTVRYVGHMRQTKEVTVTDATAVRLDVALEPSTNILDQVVVTGTVAPTNLKSVPNAITVITAKEIEQRGVTHIDQLFRGDVPGLFALRQGSGQPLDQVTMYSRGATTFSSASAGTSNSTNPIKTYLDGVELADPSYLAQLDPRNIERIEILTGPQASTIYGSNALNGVMQIFTKRGASNIPQLTLNLLSGWVENNFSNARTPQHDDNGQLNGIEGRISYNIGGSWNYVGPWTPAKQTTQRSGFGGTRLELPTSLGRVTTDVSLRRTITKNLQHGAASQVVTDYQQTGWFSGARAAGVTQPTTYTLTGQTLGFTLGYSPTTWWSHELVVGQDISDTERRYTAPAYTTPSDSMLNLVQTNTARQSQRYTSTIRIPVTAVTQATVTVGGDAWQNLTSFLGLSPQTLTGTLNSASYSVRRQPGHNAGGFVQSQLGVFDRLFLTYGLRAEWNPGFGADVSPNYAPRYGLAYSQDIGALTAKVRASYGRSTRPPYTTEKQAQTLIDIYGAGEPNLLYYGNIDYFKANPDLLPEYQQGGEGGLELYFGSRGSLIVTRYNQTVDNLIFQTPVDSARSLAPCAGVCYGDNYDVNGYGYWYQYQFLNLGSLRNQGWETQASLSLGPLTTKGTYSWTKSRVLGITPKYRAAFAGIDEYQPGATIPFLSEHTWALGMTYATTRTTVTLNTNGSGQARVNFDKYYLQNLSSSIRLPQNRQSFTPSRYMSFNALYPLTDLSGTSRLSTRIEGIVQVQNLLNRSTHDTNNSYPTIGRQSKVGIRLRT